MSRFRSRWLALFGGATLIALSLTSALGAKPEADSNAGLQVSPFVQNLGDEVEEPTDEQSDDPADTDDVDDEDEADEPDEADDVDDADEADEADEADDVDDADEADEAEDD